MDVDTILPFVSVKQSSGSRLLILYACITVLFILSIPGVTGTTTGIHIVKYGEDGKTVVAEKNVNYSWMEQYLPVIGDGITHYYHQGPVFVDDPDPVKEEQARWNQGEDRNVKEKDMGALKGTRLSDLANLVGGMTPGDTIRIRASDGYFRTFAYENVYEPSSHQGPPVITWYRADEGYVPNYTTGMRLVFFADNSTNPEGINAFGNNDWHESASPEYWYYYVQGSERYPTTTGLSVQSVSDIAIYRNESYGNASPRMPPTSGAPGSATLCAVLVLLGYILSRGKTYG